jgi:hypothetical protein
MQVDRSHSGSGNDITRMYIVRHVKKRNEFSLNDNQEEGMRSRFRGLTQVKSSEPISTKCFGLLAPAHKNT